MLMVVISTITPLFLMVFGGWFALHKRLLPDNSAKTLNDFVFYFTLPALLFSSLATTPIEEIFRLRFATGYTLSMLVSYTLMFAISALLLKTRGEECCIRSALASFPNSAFLGLPIIIALFDDTSETMVIVTLAILLPTIMVMLVITQFEIYSNKDGKSVTEIIREVLLSLVKTPGVTVAFLGIGASLLELKIPASLMSAMHDFGMASVPCSLFAIGMLLKSLKPQLKIRTMLSVNLFKLVLQPALAAVFLYLFGITGKPLVVGALLAGMPSAPLVSVFSQVYGTGEAEASTTILSSMLIYVPVFWVSLSVANSFGFTF